MSAGPGGAPGLVATYRLQLHAGFTFSDAATAVPYLADLGISHLYLSPILQAAPGSTHGYDQCDPTRISAELGGESGFRRLASVARAHGMGILLDIVPNHMATSQTNPWWWELLRSGRTGSAAAYFDIDWEAPDADVRGRVMVPCLARPTDDVLALGELTLVDHDRQPTLAYYEQRFPLADPASVGAGGTVTRELLDRQHYELAFWREALDTLNYRRFFNIDSLVALRQEDPAVFAASHVATLQLLQQGDVQGLRVDHVDGLRDPRGYLQALRGRAPGSWLLVEKILEPGERLPADWPVDGTTGYEFINRLQGLFVERGSEEILTNFYAEFTGEPVDYAEVVKDAKLEAARDLFQPDVLRLERLLAAACQDRGVDVSRDDRVEVIRHVAAGLDVYRTYSTAGSAVTSESRALVDTAIAAARKAAPAIPAQLLAVVHEALLLEGEGAASIEFAIRFQQMSGPLMAKGVEDTAFYRYNRLVCLNEVGGNPGQFGVAPEEFHAANLETLERHPHAMLASSTHDTKRSEDVRARLSLLTQVAEQWTAAVRRWAAMNEPHRRTGVPDRNAEYLLYQTLVGAWPLTEDRVQAFMAKAAREARQHTSWTDPDGDYEGALTAFVGAVMANRAFQRDLEAFVRPIIEPGRAVSLAQALLKLTAPGVPDLYQGTELWDLSLVDPDNRRPVDYGLRRELMRQRSRTKRYGGVAEGMFSTRWDDGLPKLHVTARALMVRRSSAAAFGRQSTYTPLYAEGQASGHLIAYGRGSSADPLMTVVVVPRLTLGNPPDWSGTRLRVGAGGWEEVLWGGDRRSGPWIDVADLFQRYPLALLERAA